MYSFLDILRCILCCDDECHPDRDYETLQREPLLHSASSDTSVTQSSSLPKPPSSCSTGVPPAIPSSVASSSSSLRRSSSSVGPPSFTPGQPVSSAKPPASSFKPSSPLGVSRQASSQPTPSNLKNSASSKQGKPKDAEDWIKKDATPNIPKKPLSKPTLSALSLDSTNKQTKANYIWLEEGTTQMYVIPKDIEEVIKKDFVPDVLKKPLSPSIYKDYFAALLYAEDFYIEKWSGFQLFNVTLKLHKAAIYKKSSKSKNLEVSDEKDDKTFIAFKIDSVPERRPFLLSRDFVHARHVGGKSEEFKGIIYKVIKSNTVLVEFEENFYCQHQSNHKYDISFSFNRICLKRAHQAIAAASGPLFWNYLFPHCASRKNSPESTSFPYCNYELDSDANSAVQHILSFQGSPPYLIEGPLSVEDDELSKTGIAVREAVFQIYRRSSTARILICAPKNKTCDMLRASLKEEIPESDMFRANAAFREIDGVPADILPLCRYKGECFTCPSLEKLRQFRVIFSTFVSSFRLHDKGITAGHFSQIFLVDNSSTAEPETMIALSNLANENTSVIVTGASNQLAGWVRSDIARKNGLRISYFKRLCENETYKSLEPMFITQL